MMQLSGFWINERVVNSEGNLPTGIVSQLELSLVVDPKNWTLP